MTVAYSTGCGLYDPTTNRPTVGMFNFCNASFDSDLDDQLSTVVHEVVHILVGESVGGVEEGKSVGVHLRDRGVIKDKAGAEALQARIYEACYSHAPLAPCSLNPPTLNHPSNILLMLPPPARHLPRSPAPQGFQPAGQRRVFHQPPQPAAGGRQRPAASRIRFGLLAVPEQLHHGDHTNRRSGGELSRDCARAQHTAS